MQMTGQYDIFISYSRRDREFAERLHDALQQSGQVAWIDWIDIPTGSDWAEEIQEGIEKANSFLFVISPDSLASKYCAEEIIHARKYNKRILPILYRTCDSQFQAGHLAHTLLNRHQRLDFGDDNDFDITFAELLSAIKTDLEHVKIHTQLLQRAIEWEKHDRDESLLLWGNNLEEVEQWLQAGSDKEPRASELHWEYVGASRKSEIEDQQTARRKQRNVIVTLSCLSILASGTMIAAFYQRDAANKQRDVAKTQGEIAKLREQSANVLKLLAMPDTTKALILAIDASDRSTNHPQKLQDDVQSSLLNAVQQAKEMNFYAQPEKAEKILAVSSNGQRAIVDMGDHVQVVSLINNPSSTDKSLSLKGDRKTLTSAVFSRDGDRVLTVSSDAKGAEVQIWETDSGKLIQGFLLQVTWPKTSNRIRMLGRPFSLLPKSSLQNFYQINRVRWNSTEDQILTVDGQGRAALWNLTGESISPLELTSVGISSEKIRNAEFSPDGRYILSTATNNQLQIWNREGRLLHILRGHEAEVTDIKFSGDGRRVVTAAKDKTVRVWDSQSDQLLLTLRPPMEVAQVAFSPDGQRIATGGIDGKIQLWNLQGVPTEQLKGHLGGIRTLAWRENARLISSSDDGTVRQWDVSIPDRRQLEESAPDRPSDSMSNKDTSSPSLMALGCQGKQADRLTENGVLTHWDDQGKVTPAINFGLWQMGWQASDQRITAFAIDCARKLLVTGNSLGNLQLWDLQRKAMISQTLTGHTSAVSAIAFSRQGDRLVSGDRDGTMRLWNPSQWKAKQSDSNISLNAPLSAHRGAILSLGFSATGKRIVSAGSDGRLRFWRRDGKPLSNQIQGYVGWFRSVAFGKDDQRVITGGDADDRLVRIWNVSEKVMIGAPSMQHATAVIAVGADAKGKTLSLSADGILHRGETSRTGLLMRACRRLRHHPLLREPEMIMQGQNSEQDTKFLKAAKQSRKICKDFWQNDKDTR